MKELNEEQLSELERLKDWSLTLVQYLVENAEEGSYMITRVEDVIHTTYENKNLRGMKVIFNDVRQWVKGLPKSDIDIINQRLKAKFGQDLTQTALPKRSGRSLKEVL